MDSNNQNLFDLQIDQPVTTYLGETAKWAKFLAIVGFVFCGIIALVAIFAGSAMSAAFGSAGIDGGASGVIVTVVYLIVAVIAFFPYLFLFHFANKMQRALRQNDQFSLTESFKNLKSCYKFVGILTIISLSFWVIMIAIALITAGALQ